VFEVQEEKDVFVRGKLIEYFEECWDLKALAAIRVSDSTIW
jgi:hypothetical protein